MNIGDKVERMAVRIRQEGKPLPANVPGTARRPPAATTSGACYIAEVDSDATGGGYYNCHLQTLDATDWNTTTADQIDDTGGSVVVANMGEIGGSAHALDAGDMLLCWQFTDDEGNSRYIGLSPKYFWWHA